MILVDRVLEDLRQLDESQKATIPQFVADYIKYAIENDWDFQDLFKCIEDEEDEELTRWVYHERNQETLAAAWINGYEVEKEKRYLVKMKNLRALFCYLAYIPDEGYWTLMASGGKSIVIKHTRKQLEEAGFGWVFDCEGMEVEEV
ncbi:DUF1642 domain-containing protein [Streptococcus parasanguinis]|jgi:hypothetical protein|uniref:DUF1642 domain-containing protein n=1 Tax=Streptococcus parasanguinis TaxID=1318 RepID=UPI0020015858|nr:DUF1642 domain-containing protein [Streptococcus parasanguinis]DAN77198.1 MAG TPA: Protein of unknown function (DUF1642) [Caudoviricetes sp.]